jgi:hypothetical protein
LIFDGSFELLQIHFVYLLIWNLLDEYIWQEQQKLPPDVQANECSVFNKSFSKVSASD